MSTRDLVIRLSKLGVKLIVENNELRVTAPKGALTKTLREEISQAKVELIELVKAGIGAQQAQTRTIPRADRNQRIPLSFAQKRIWFLEELEGGTSVYNIAWATRLQGKLSKTPKNP